VVIRRLPRATARAIRVWVPWALAWVFVVLAAASLTGRVLTAQLEGSEEAIAARVAEATGFEVRITSLRGRFLGWHPVLEVDDLELSREGVEVLRLGRVRFELDVTESLARGRPVAAALVVDELVVQLERDGEGGIRLLGGAGGEPPELEPIVSFLYDSDYVDLRAARVVLHDGAPGVRGTHPLAELEMRGALQGRTFAHRGHLRAELSVGGADGAPARAELHLELAGDPADPSTRAGSALLSVSDVDVAALAPLLGDRLPAVEGVVERLRIRADFDPDDGTGFRALLAASELRLERTAAVRARNLRLDLEGRADGAGSGDVVLREARLLVGDEALTVDGAALGWRPGASGGARLHAAVGELDVASLVRLVRGLDVLGPRATRWLENLDPEAQLEAARLVVEPDAREGALSVQVRDLALRGYRGVPRVRGVDAGAVVHEGGAWIDIDSGPFYLHFPDVFEEGWRYDSAQGRIDLRFAPAGLQLLSDRMEIVGPQGRAAGHFALHLPQRPEDRRITLALGLQGADAAFTEAFLPEKLNPELRGWLADAVRAGRVDEGAVLINGAGRQSQRGDRATGLWFDFRAGRIAFDPAWPPATSLEGRVLAGADGVRGDLRAGRLGGLELARTSFRVPRSPLGPLPGGQVVELTGVGRGDGRVVIDFLREAPLGGGLEFLEDDWDAIGAVDFAFDMTVPLDGRAVEHIDVDAELLLDRLRIGQADLDFGNVSGRIAYRHPGYLTSADARGELFGGPVELRLAGSVEEGADGLLVEGRGFAEGRALADWLRIDVLARLAGRAPYDSRLRIRPGGSVDLLVDSPAPAAGKTGLVTSLPAPLEAPADPLQIRVLVEPDGPMDVQLDWGAFHSRFELLDGAFERGTLAINAPLEDLPAVGLSAVGRADELEVGAWLDAIDRWQQDAIIFGRDEGTFDDLLLDFAIAIDEARWDALRFGPARMSLTGFLAEMNLGFAAERVAGRILIPDDDRPLGVTLDRLDLPLDPALPAIRVRAAEGESGAGAPAAGESGAALFAAEGATEPPVREVGPSLGPAGIDGSKGEAGDEDADSIALLLADLEPDTVPEMDVTLASFSDHGENLGRASFAVRPFRDGLRLQDIDAEGRGLVFGPDADGDAFIELGLVPWPFTRVVGRLSGEDAERVLTRFGLAPTLDAEEFAFSVDVGWEGPADDPVLATLSGVVDLDVERGRFNEIEAGGGPLRVVGLFNFDAMARRMRLDFSDVYRRGIAFEEIDGVLTLENGRLRTAEPVRISGPQSRFVLTGDLDIESRMLAGDLVVTLPVSKNLPWAAAYAALVNPLAGAGVLMAERIFRDQIDRFSSARYRISGTMDAPEVAFDTIFENQIEAADGELPGEGVPVDDTPSAEPLAAVIDPPRADSGAASSEEP
jgi:uncharacterized protein (TIGR02099 family)